MEAEVTDVTVVARCYQYFMIFFPTHRRILSSSQCLICIKCSECHQPVTGTYTRSAVWWFSIWKWANVPLWWRRWCCWRCLGWGSYERLDLHFHQRNHHRQTRNHNGLCGWLPPWESWWMAAPHQIGNMFKKSTPCSIMQKRLFPF